MNNGDKIRSMTNEKLSEWLDRQHNSNREDWCVIGCYNCIYYGTHHADKSYVGTEYEHLYKCKNCEFENGISGWLEIDCNDI